MKPACSRTTIKPTAFGEGRKMGKTKISKILFILIAAVFCLGRAGLAAEPTGTAFTYQGRLIDNNSVADGLYDFRFQLYDSVSGGSQTGTEVNVPDTDVIDGYFTADLDFGAVFNGDERWLEIGIRKGELDDPNEYTVVSPRQQIKPSPYALSVRYPLETIQPSSEPLIGVVNTGSGFAIGGAGSSGAGVLGIHLSSGNYGVLGDANSGVCGVAAGSGDAGHFEGDVSLVGDLIVADSGKIFLEYDGGIESAHDAEISIGNDFTEIISGDRVTTISGQSETSVGMSSSVATGLDLSLTSGRHFYLNAGSEMNIHSGDMTLYTVGDWDVNSEEYATITAGKKLTVEVGQAKTTWNKNGYIQFCGTVVMPTLVASSGIPVVVDDSGQMYASLSSKRYKTDIADLDSNAEAVLNLRPVKFTYKTTGSNDIVIYNSSGQPEAVKYDKISLYLIETVKQLKEENEQLRRRLGILEKSFQEGRADTGKEIWK
jgi:hypothetical protein